MEDVMDFKSLIPVGRNRTALRRDWNPFDTLQWEIDRVFDDFGRGFPGFRGTDLTPKMDVTETDKEIEITAELSDADPGAEAAHGGAHNRRATRRGERDRTAPHDGLLSRRSSP
jgi:hypothetical protein